MATIDPAPTNSSQRPAGASGDGMDAYPTYRDGPTTPHRAGSGKPTDVGLPRSRRTYATPILIGLVVFAAVIIVRLVWGGFQLASTTDEAMTPGGPAASTTPATSPASSSTSDAASGQAGTLNRDAEPAQQAGPGQVGAEPNAADVPGGATTTPVQ